MSTLEQQYAAAFYSLTQDEAALRQSADNLMAQGPLWQALISPAVSPREKCAVLRRMEVCPPVLSNLYMVLAQRGRLALLPRIVQAVHGLALAERNAAVCRMACVHRPDAARLEQLKKILCRLHHKADIEMQVHFDPSLLGGFILEIEGTTYDRSVRGQLSGLSRQLQGRVTL